MPWLPLRTIADDTLHSTGWGTYGPASTGIVKTAFSVATQFSRIVEDKLCRDVNGKSAVLVGSHAVSRLLLRQKYPVKCANSPQTMLEAGGSPVDHLFCVYCYAELDITTLKSTARLARYLFETCPNPVGWEDRLPRETSFSLIISQFIPKRRALPHASFAWMTSPTSKSPQPAKTCYAALAKQADLLVVPTACFHFSNSLR